MWVALMALWPLYFTHRDDRPETDLIAEGSFHRYTLAFPSEQARAEFWSGVAASCVTPKEDDDQRAGHTEDRP